MNRISHLIAMIALVLTVCQGVQAQPGIAFRQEKQEVGYVLWRHPITVNYTFTNTGDRPLVLSNVTTSCGCTTAEWTREPIPAGGTGKVSAVFDAEAIGHFVKEVGVYCNASPQPLYLEFSGEVTADARNYTFTHPIAFGAIRLDKDEIAFEDVNKGDRPRVELLVANTSGKNYTPVLMHLPPYLSAVAEPEVLARGKNGKITVTLDTDKLPKLGITRTSVYLSRYPGDKVGTDNELPVSVALLADFSSAEKDNPPVLELSVADAELVFEPLESRQKKSKTILIRNTGRSDLVIQDMQVFSIALGVKLNKRVLKPGETAKMKVTVLAENLPRIKGTPRILMMTNDPQRPKVSIRVRAALKQ